MEELGANKQLIITVITGILAAAPIIYSAIMRGKAEIPKTNADAVITVVDSIETLLKPLNDRVKALEKEAANYRRLRSIDSEIIEIKASYVAHLNTVITVLLRQLEENNIIPAFERNGEIQEYKEKLEKTKQRRREMEDECKD